MKEVEMEFLTADEMQGINSKKFLAPRLEVGRVLLKAYCAAFKASSRLSKR